MQIKVPYVRVIISLHNQRTFKCSYISFGATFYRSRRLFFESFEFMIISFVAESRCFSVHVLIVESVWSWGVAGFQSRRLPVGVVVTLAGRYRLVVVWGGPGGVSHSSGSSTSSSECGRGTGPHFHQNNSLAASFGIAPRACLYPSTPLPATPPPAHVKINNILIHDVVISILNTALLKFRLPSYDVSLY